MMVKLKLSNSPELFLELGQQCQYDQHPVFAGTIEHKQWENKGDLRKGTRGTDIMFQLTTTILKLKSHLQRRPRKLYRAQI